MRVLTLLALVVSLAGRVEGGDDEDAVLAAFMAKDQKRLNELAAKDKRDPWLVAEVLCQKGGHYDAALAFAKAAPRPDTEKLPAYVLARRSQEVPSASQAYLRQLYFAQTARGSDYEKALTILETIEAPDGSTWAIQQDLERAKLLLRLERYNESIRVCLSTAEAAERMGWLSKAARVANQGSRTALLFDRSQLLPTAKLVLQIQERRKNQPAIGKALGMLGWAQQVSGNDRQALVFFERSVTVLRQLGDGVSVASGLGAMGAVYEKLLDYPQAIDHYRRAAKIAEEHQAWIGLALTELSLGAVINALEGYEAATVHLRRALTAIEKVTRSSEREVYKALILTSMAWVYAANGRSEEARDYLKRAPRLAPQLNLPGFNQLHLTLLLAVGRIRLLLGDNEAALASCEAALLRAKQIKGHEIQVADILGHIGAAHTALGSHEKARDMLSRAVAMYRAQGEPTPWAAALGRVLLDRLKRPRDAVAALEEAVVLSEVQRRQLSGLSGRQRLRFERFSEALTPANASYPHQAMVRAQLALGLAGEALRYAERGRARMVLDLLERSRFDPLQEAERRARIADDTETVARIVKVRTALAAAETRIRHATYATSDKRVPAFHIKKLRAQQLDARSEREKVLQQRAALEQALLPVVRPAMPAEIQRLLGPNERMLFYVVTKTASWTLLVPPAGGKVQAFELTWPDGKPLSEESLKEAVRQYRASLATAGKIARGLEPLEEPERGELGPRLYDALVPKRIRADLQKLEHVYVVPHGPLHRLPLEALVVGEGPKYWLDALPPVSYVQSGSVLAWCRRLRDAQLGKRNAYQVVALGDAIFTRGKTKPGRSALDRFGTLAPLPGTRRELEAIRKALQGKPIALLLGEDATKAKLFELAPKCRYLHLATHQLVDEREYLGYSRLALTRPRKVTDADDGYLSLYEIFENWRDRLSQCELVVLSACQTAEGRIQKDDGPYNMPLGFLYAGAPAVIGSLWRVDDASTAMLFGEFYRRTAKGTPKLKAFAEARQAVRKKYPQPYFWAPFVYVGDPR